MSRDMRCRIDRVAMFVSLFTMVQAHLLHAQEQQIIRGIIMDETTRQPVPYAHLQIHHTHQGTVANQEGAFSFLFTGVLDDTLVISSIGYESLRLSMEQLIKKDTFFLKEATLTLNPILITSLTAEEFVKKSIQSIPKNYPQNSRFTGFYRTATKECQTFVRLSEGPVEVIDPGYLSKDTVHVAYLNRQESKDYRAYKLEEQHLLEDALNFEHIRLRSGFLNPATLDGWKYEMIGYTQYDGKGVMIISASYIADKNKMNHSAKIYMDDTNFAIYKVAYEYNWLDHHFKKSSIDSLLEAEHQWEGEFHYAYDQDQCYLKYFVFHHTKTLYDFMYKRKVCEIEVYSELNIYETEANMLEYASQLPKPVETALYKNILQDLDSLSRIQP
jgi:hypothetical protein